MAATLAFRASGGGSFHANREPGAFQDALVEMTADNSYPATGYPFGIAQLQALGGGAFSAVESVEIANNWTDNAAAPAHSFVAVFDKTRNTVRAMGSPAAAAQNTPFLEVASANAALNGFTCTLRVRFI